VLLRKEKLSGLSFIGTKQNRTE